MDFYTFRDYRIYYQNIGTLKVQLETIFEHQIYQPLHVDKTNPYIIDCGANIGVSVMYFKSIFPQSEIIAFEPEPVVYDTLVSNIKLNCISNVTTIKSALNNIVENKILISDENDSSKLLLFDNHHKNKNSINIDKIVRCELLSEYLNKPVDFLKMNIEGAEINVLNEIGSKICNIKEAVIEYHYYSQQEQQLHNLLELLHKNYLLYTIRHVFRGYDQYLNPFPKPDDNLNIDTRYCILIYACRRS